MRIVLASACVLLWISYVHCQMVSAPPSAVNDKIVHENIGAPTATVFTYGRRPLEEALIRFNREYGWAIDYEDAPVVDASEIVDDNASFRLNDPNYPEKELFPKGQPFTATVSEDQPGSADVATVLQQLLTIYNASGNPGHYRLARTSQGTFVMEGDRYRSESGGEVSYAPVLGCVISANIPPSQLHDALEIVAASLNNTCRGSNLNVDYAALLGEQLTSGKVSGTYDVMSAREIIVSLLSQEPGLMFYTVDYIPGIRQFNLYTWLTFKRKTIVVGDERLEPVLNSAVMGTRDH